LLHGPPGTGKTTTAEALSAHLNKPVFSIRATDLGTTTKEMERNVTQFFRQADRWGCIILMREADMVLEQRTSNYREGSTMSSGESIFRL